MDGGDADTPIYDLRPGTSKELGLKYGKANKQSKRIIWHLELSRVECQVRECGWPVMQLVGYFRNGKLEAWTVYNISSLR